MNAVQEKELDKRSENICFMLEYFEFVDDEVFVCTVCSLSALHYPAKKNRKKKTF